MNLNVLILNIKVSVVRENSDLDISNKHLNIITRLDDRGKVALDIDVSQIRGQSKAFLY